MKQLSGSETSRKKSIFRQYWYIWFLGVMFVCLVVAYLLRIFTPPPPTQTTPNTRRGVTPGKSTLQEVTQQLGPPLKEESTVDGTKFSYQSDYPSLPNQVVVKNGERTISFVKEYVSPNAQEMLQTYVDTLGPYDLDLFDEESGGATKAYVFLSKGLVIVAHIVDGSVEQKWYFEPVDRDVFLSSWGKGLGADGEGPEVPEQNQTSP